MGFIKTFMLGAATAYGIQYINRKRTDGSSILSDFIEDPRNFFKKTISFKKAEEPLEDITIIVSP